MIEKDEDKAIYLEKMGNTSLNQRREEGVTWYPLAIRDEYYGVGDRLIVEFERMGGRDSPHQFQTGKIAALFSNAYPDEEKLSGVITSVRENTLKITFFADELPDWVSRGKMGLDLMFDETSYREMESAVSAVIKAKNNRIAELREVLLGHAKPQYYTEQPEISSENLNASQNAALNNALSAADVAIIHGPPGTGKTTTLVQVIAECLKEEEQVLVTAASNTAVDLLTQKLHDAGLVVLRIGNPARVNEEQLKHTLDWQVSEHREFKRIKELRKKAAEFRNMAGKYKRQFGKAERDQRRMIYDEARKMAQEAVQIENYITKSLIESAQAITCTLVGSVNQAIRERDFSSVFIDEAAQALEPACWIPVMKANRVIFAGDHCQLPPTVKSFAAGKEGLSVTLFEKTIQRQKVDVMLQTQYRMNEKIMNFSSDWFYKGQLEAHESVKNHVLQEGEDEVLSTPFEFIDTAGSGFEEKTDPRTLSTYNEEEAKLVVKHFSLLLEKMKAAGINSTGLTAGIISPYNAQVERLKNLVGASEIIAASPIKANVNSIDGFQGQERDIIYISLVRSNTDKEIGFLKDIRRMNVAITRARKKLVIFGDSATLSTNEFYNSFMEYAEKQGAYKSVWEFME